MIDFHNHVLAEVDDGPKSLDESISMLRTAKEQGVTEVVQTVHFQHPKMEGKNVDYQYLKNKLEELQVKVYKKKLNIKLHLAAEVFYLPNLLQISKNPLVTIGNGKYMLIEFSTNIFPSGFEKQFYDLQLSGINPVVAHPERYRFVQKDIDILNTWIDRGYIIQLDAGSLIGQFGRRIQDISAEILNRGMLHLIGSDAHNERKRNFCIAEAYKKIEIDNCKENAYILKKNSKNLLNGDSLDTLIIKNHKMNKKIVSYLKEKLSKLL